MVAKSWPTRYQEHGVWSQLQSIQSLINENPVSDPVHRRQVEDIKYVVSGVLELKSVQPYFISQARLAALETSVNVVLASLSSWTQTGDEAFIENAYNPHLADLQDEAFGWASGKSDTLHSAAALLRATQESLVTTVADFDRRTDLQRAGLSRLGHEFGTATEEKIAAYKAEITEKENALTLQMQQVASQLAQVEGQLMQLSKQATQNISAWQEQFTTAETGRSTTHGELIKQHQTVLRDFEKEEARQSETFRDEQEGLFTATRKRVEELKTEIEAVVGAVGTTATAKWYETYSLNQRGEADTWRKVAMGAFLAAFIVIALSVFAFGSNDESWKSTILKTSATASLVAGAIYATRESSKHRKQEFDAKRTELTLRALDPFIATLKENPRASLKVEAARQVFLLNGIPLDVELETDELDQDPELA